MEKKFMTAAEWENRKKFTGRYILKWAEVSQETVYVVMFLERKENPIFTSYIIHYTDKNYKTYKCWAPQHFVVCIQRRRLTNQRLYFVSKGTKGTNKVAKFDIIFQDLNKEYSIFDHEVYGERRRFPIANCAKKRTTEYSGAHSNGTKYGRISLSHEKTFYW